MKQALYGVGVIYAGTEALFMPSAFAVLAFFAVLLVLWLVRLAEFTKHLSRVQFRHSLAIRPKRTFAEKALMHCYRQRHKQL